MIILYLRWYFWEFPKEIIRIWKNFILFCINFFSIPFLFKTLFSYWHKHSWKYEKGSGISRFFESLTGNIISRGLGAIMRMLLILLGFFVFTLVIILGVIFLISWIFLPLVIICLIIFGINFIL